MPIFNMVGGGGYKKLDKYWLMASTLPYPFVGGSAVVLNDGIHILGSGYGDSMPGNSTKHYLYADAYIKA